MRRVLLLGFVVVLMAAQASAFSGFGEAYIWMTDQPNSGAPAYAYTNITLKVLKIGDDLKAVAGSFQAFSPTIQSNYADVAQWSYIAGEMANPPVIYQNSTDQGYGTLLIGAYYDNSPAALGATRLVMDTLRLEPQADGSLNMVNVHTGTADVSGQFHTEDANQVMYDKDGLFTGTPDSILMHGMGGSMTSRTDGYATDMDHDGMFDGAADTETYMNLSQRNKTMLYENYQFSVGYRSPGQALQQMVNNGGAYTMTDYYSDQNGGKTLAGSGQQGGAGLAVADINGNDIPDVFVATGNVFAVDHDDNAETADKTVAGILHLEDLNGNGLIDYGTDEEKVFVRFGRMNQCDSPDIQNYPNNIFEPNGTTTPLGLIQNDQGEWALLTNSPGYWAWNVTLAALSISPDNGVWGGEYQIIATQLSSTGRDWEYNAMLAGIDSYTLDTIGTAEIPEPATLLLIGSGLVGAIGFMRRRRMQ